MKKFYDRQQEMDQLRDMQQQAYTDYSRFVVLTGRRRVGKTSLVTRLMEETAGQAPGLYFFVGRKTEAVLVKTFCEEVRSKLGEYVPEGIVTFRGLMQLLLEIGKRRCFTLFIDEFQEFDNVNAGVFSDVQELWDRYKKDTHLCLVVSGSIFRMMEKIFSLSTGSGLYRTMLPKRRPVISGIPGIPRFALSTTMPSLSKYMQELM